MDSHFPQRLKLSLKGFFFFLICMFLNTFKINLSLVKLKPQNFITGLHHRVQKNKKH